MAQTQVKVPYLENYDFGVGADFATGSPMGKVVTGEVSGVTAAQGAKTQYTISRIHSTSELERALGISVEASGGCGCFSASARMDYAKTAKIQSSSLFMAITATVVLENLSIDDPTLSPAALEIAGRPDVFGGRYGNMFVRGIGRGGLFVAVMQVDTSDSEEAESISASLSGSYGLFSAEAEMSFSEVQKKHRAETRISVYHEGGPIDLSMDDITDAPQLYTMLQQWLTSFETDPAKYSVPYSVTLAPIAIANGPIPPNAADIQHAQDVLVLCAKQRSQILDGLNNMDYIAQHPGNYDYIPPTTPADIVKAFVGYQHDLDVVAETASYAIDHVIDAMGPADFAVKSGKVYPQGVPPTPMPTVQKGATDALAAYGEVLVNQDPLAGLLRDQQPEGATRRGFYIGMAKADGHTELGPGKDAFGARLPAAEQPGFRRGVEFIVARNKNAGLAGRGAAVAKADPAVLAVARANPNIHYCLGFDIATGIYGDPALGAQGNTAAGPGAFRIRDALSADGQRGFMDGVAFHLGPPLRPRRPA